MRATSSEGGTVMAAPVSSNGVVLLWLRMVWWWAPVTACHLWPECHSTRKHCNASWPYNVLSLRVARAS